MAKSYGSRSRSVIGKPGPRKGPSKTSMSGTISTGNLGRATSGKTYTGANHDVSAAFSRGIQSKSRLGPGGSQRP
jgi:hypothetical protein